MYVCVSRTVLLSGILEAHGPYEILGGDINSGHFVKARLS